MQKKAEGMATKKNEKIGDFQPGRGIRKQLLCSTLLNEGG
jgi:hypothetical protein